MSASELIAHDFGFSNVRLPEDGAEHVYDMLSQISSVTGMPPKLLGDGCELHLGNRELIKKENDNIVIQITKSTKTDFLAALIGTAMAMIQPSDLLNIAVQRKIEKEEAEKIAMNKWVSTETMIYTFADYLSSITEGDNPQEIKSAILEIIHDRNHADTNEILQRIAGLLNVEDEALDENFWESFYNIIEANKKYVSEIQKIRNDPRMPDDLYVNASYFDRISHFMEENDNRPEIFFIAFGAAIGAWFANKTNTSPSFDFGKIMPTPEEIKEINDNLDNFIHALAVDNHKPSAPKM